jgi:hypothetical protein
MVSGVHRHPRWAFGAGSVLAMYDLPATLSNDLLKGLTREARGGKIRLDNSEIAIEDHH